MDRSLEEENITNKTKSIDIQTSNFGDDSNQSSQNNIDDNNNQEQINVDSLEDVAKLPPEKIDQQQQFTSSKNLNESNQDMRIHDDVEHEYLQNQQNNSQQNQQQLKNDGFNQQIKVQQNHIYENKIKVKKYAKKRNEQVQSHTLANDPSFLISDKKIWAVSGVMPGSVSKKFIRSYKLGRYNKVKSLKDDMEYFNSPHHEQQHLGNNIFPFQNNKSRVFTMGSFDYRKYTNPTQQPNSPLTNYRFKSVSNNKLGGMQESQSENKLGITGMSTKSKKKQLSSLSSVFSPRTTTNTVMNQVLQQTNVENVQSLQKQQMEIRYIDIISQPIVKSTNFINNTKCPHSLTNMRTTNRKNIFFFNNPNINYNTHNNHIENMKQPISPRNHNQNHEISVQAGYEGTDSHDAFQDILQNRKYGVNDFFGEEIIQSHENINLFHQYHQSSGNGLPKQNIVFQPKTFSFNSTMRNPISSEFLSTQNQFNQNENGYHKKSRTQNNLNPQSSNQLRLPQFATNPENIAFFPKAKQNLVKYVNQIGVQDNPLRNTFVNRKDHF